MSLFTSPKGYMRCTNTFWTFNKGRNIRPDKQFHGHLNPYKWILSGAGKYRPKKESE